MKKIAAAALAASIAGPALAGGYAEPIIEVPVVVVDETVASSSAQDIVIPLLLLAVIAAAAAN